METDEVFAPEDVLIARTSPAGFAWFCDGRNQTDDPELGWLPYEHLILLSDALMRVATGQCKRLIVTMPPRHGKSNLISQYFPAWYLGNYPTKKIILASNTATLAEDFSRKARDALSEYGGPIFGVTPKAGVAAGNRWETSEDGIVIAAGVGGPITGRGANLLIIDDPVKNDEEAASALIRGKHWDWWRGTARTRLQKGGAVVVVQTRWHEDDLAGRMIELAEDNEKADQWEVLNLPALAEEGDPISREVGEALCPGLMPIDELETTRQTLGSYRWSALYQQHPAPPEGLMFRSSNFRYYREQMEGAARQYLLHAEEDEVRTLDAGACTRFQVADIAASAKQTADYTVVGTFAVTADRDLVVVQITRQKFEIMQVGDFLMRENDAHGNPPIWVESFGHGTGPVQVMTKAGYPVRKLEKGHGAQLEKLARASNAVARYEMHTIFHPARGAADWLDDFEDELKMFPAGAHDDQVDVISYAARLLPMIGIGEHVQKPPKDPTTFTGGVTRRQF